MFGRDQRLRTSTLIQDRPDRGEEQNILRGIRRVFFRSYDKTHHGMMVMPKVIFGVSQEISFIAIVWNPESNCTCRVKKHFSIPLKYIDVTRTTHTSRDVLLDKHVDEYWNVDEDRELSDAWTGFTRSF